MILKKVDVGLSDYRLAITKCDRTALWDAELVHLIKVT